MAITTNTFTSFDAKGIREQLSDVISSISPEEVPLQSNLGSVNVSNTYFEWQTDSLNAVSKTARADGDELETLSTVHPQQLASVIIRTFCVEQLSLPTTYLTSRWPEDRMKWRCN